MKPRKIPIIDGMPKHNCTKLCDGQRYCFMPGTHTVLMWWRYEDPETLKPILAVSIYKDCDVVAIVRDGEAKPPRKVRGIIGRTRRPRDPRNVYGFLVTLKARNSLTSKDFWGLDNIE